MTQIVTLVKGSYAIVIRSAKVEEILTNELTKIERPVVKSQQGTRTPGTTVSDKKKIVHVFNIQGVIDAEVGGGNNPADYERTTSGQPAYDSGDTAGYSTAKNVKISLIKNILYPSGDIELYYRDLVDSDYGSTYYDNTAASTTHVKVSLDKISIQETSLRVDDRLNTDNALRYDVQINLTRGRTR